MTTTDLTTLMRDLHERGQRRMPCDGYELHREHGDAHMHGTVITDDCSGTTLDPSPAADLARAVADRIEATVSGLPMLEGALVVVGTKEGKPIGNPVRVSKHASIQEYETLDELGLNPDWARDLAAGEFGAVVGRIEQRLRRVGARVWWENRNESANVGCIIRGALDGNLRPLHVRNAGFPSQLDALLDALAQAAGVGSAA